MVEGVAPEDWEQWRAAYLDWFQKANLNDVIDYFRYFGGDYETREEVIKTARKNQNVEALLEMGIYGFERPTVSFNQDIAIICANPKLGLSPDSNRLPTDPNNISNIEEYDSNYRYGVASRSDPSESALEAAGAGLNWLLHDGTVLDYSRSVFRALANADIFHHSFDELLAQDPRDTLELHKQVYYTNWFKYATQDTNDMNEGLDRVGSAAEEIDFGEYFDSSDVLDHDSDPEYRIPNTVLGSEIRCLDPEIIFAFGKPVWDHFFQREAASTVAATKYFRHGVSPEELEPDDSHSSLHALPFWYQGAEMKNKRRLVIPLIFPAGQPWHPSKGLIRSGNTEEAPHMTTEKRLTDILSTFYETK